MMANGYITKLGEKKRKKKKEKTHSQEVSLSSPPSPKDKNHWKKLLLVWSLKLGTMGDTLLTIVNFLKPHNSTLHKNLRIWMRMVIIRTTFCSREEDDNNKQHQQQHHVQNNTIKLPKCVDNQVYDEHNSIIIST